MESADSIRSLYRHFLSAITKKSLNAFYYACSYAKVDYSRFAQTTATTALKLIPNSLESQPVFLCIDDTMVSKFGTRFENISKLFDHAAHNGSNYLNGHCFVILMLCVPVWNGNKVNYLSVPLEYQMRQKKESKLVLATSMAENIRPAFSGKRNVILLCDSWYAKKDILRLADTYAALDIICNARSDSVIYDFLPERTGKRGRPAKHGKKLSIYEDFLLSDEKIGDYFTGFRCVPANIFGERTVLAYVTASAREGGSRRLFFSTVSPEQLQIFCAWQEKAPLNQTGSEWMQYIPLFLYNFRWNIEASCYEQKTFRPLCSYMVRSQKGIEMLVNLINLAYCAMKLLPYQDKEYDKYRGGSVQEFRFILSSKIREQVIFATFVKNIKTSIKSNAIIEALMSLLQRQDFIS